MNKIAPQSLLGEKLAVLVANGFCEQDLTLTQRALQKTGANLRIISMDQGLVNSWAGDSWGLHYAADSALNAALAADYGVLVIPGGQRSVEKLKLTAHTKRFIGGFIDTRKPVVAFDEAIDLLAFCEKIAGRSVTGPDAMKANAENAGANWVEAPYAIDGNLITGGAARGAREGYVAAVCEFLVSGYDSAKAA
jgi:protease I